ncbi:ABC transporter permease [Paenibacillus elgii]|uniref:ABC transporter permease n=1 Tax=Paenibacillus elgii TaxID=189691 RepID=A0A2T6G939_9BACL|nr:ABC transporter permease [Paenibacillus elgii]PUA40669.1 ABC transporter permease [Paenibacillus elgii]
MIQLIKAEQLKIYNRPMVLIMGICLTIVIALVAVFNVDKSHKSETNDWKTELAEENHSLREDMQKAPEEMKPFFETQIKRNDYILEKGLSPNQMTAWKFVSLMSNFLPLITLFSLIVASDIVAGEFQWGTMKLLLIRPVSRWNLLLAKYCSVLLFAALLLALMLLLSWLIGAILFGVKGATDPFIFSRDKQTFQDIPMVMNISINYGLKMLTLFVIVTLSFVISILFRSSSWAVGISVFILFSGNLLTPILQHINAGWTKFFLFTNLNLEEYFFGSRSIEGMTLPFSIGVLLVHTFLLCLAGWIVFAKREVN